MAIPLFFPEIEDDAHLEAALKRAGLKPGNVKKSHPFNGGRLVFLTKNTHYRPGPELAAGDDLLTEGLAVHQYASSMEELIELERDAEIREHYREIRSLSPGERERAGKAILGLKGVRTEGKYHLHFVRFGRERAIRTRIGGGDMVLASKGDPLRSDLTGTVAEVGRQFVTVAFENRPPKWLFAPGVRLDLTVNDVPFKRMRENLDRFRHVPKEQRSLRNLLLAVEAPAPVRPAAFTPKNPSLNPSQQEAVALALGASDFFLLHGPPGTGKTSTLTETIRQLVARGERVLAAADSNTAADNLLERLAADESLKLVRVGHPARMSSLLERFSVFALYAATPEAEEARAGWDALENLLEKRRSLRRPSPAFRRGMSDEKILRLAKSGKGHRGVPQETVAAMADYLKLNGKIDEEGSRLRTLEQEGMKRLLREADVVVSTNSMVGSDLMEGLFFHTAVVDEGSQQIEPSTLLPLLRADRFIIAGDHRQLPPTVLSEEAAALRESLFQRLIHLYPGHARMLTVQYRMHEKIMAFPARTFYDGKLEAAPAAKNRTLEITAPQETPKALLPLFDPEKPLLFLDTGQQGEGESRPPKSPSWINREEAALTARVAGLFLKAGVPPEALGVITPYAGQERTIRELLEQEGEELPEVDTVDGFQGREKEVVLLSLVRSNRRGELGFLTDVRRLNVALTRPRRKLVVIGDASTLGNHPVYRELIDRIKFTEEAFYTPVERF